MDMISIYHAFSFSISFGGEVHACEAGGCEI
jgi:hypothetical protein